MQVPRHTHRPPRLRALDDVGDRHPTPIQARTIPPLMQGRHWQLEKAVSKVVTSWLNAEELRCTVRADPTRSRQVDPSWGF